MAFSGYKNQRRRTGNRREESQNRGRLEEKKKTDFRSSVSSQRNRGG
jgi:hypothetical protein